MTRAVTAAVLAELIAASKRPALFFEGEFASGWVRVWSGLGPLVWNGFTWQGIGQLGKVSAIEETADVKARGVAVQLSGVDPALIATVYNEARRGKPGNVYLGFLDAAGNAIADPYLAFPGRLDVPEDEDDGETATITIAYESRLIDLERSRERRYTPEDQKINYPNDLGFDFVPGLQDAPIKWGSG